VRKEKKEKIEKEREREWSVKRVVGIPIRPVTTSLPSSLTSGHRFFFLSLSFSFFFFFLILCGE